ncbi:hypothetical protein BDR07DRAFT_1615088 [Suillus spraguei]|nr:hypothetical protein BDR07DRAFT_1615088 [Suillus spraguei]
MQCLPKKCERNLLKWSKKLEADHIAERLNAAISAINATKDLVPIEMAKSILGIIASILTVAQLRIKNESDFQAIVDMCDTIRDILERATKGAAEDNLPGYLDHALSRLKETISRINNEVITSKEQGRLHKLFSVTIDRDRISRWKQDLDEILKLFGAEALIGIAIGVENLNLTFRPKTNTYGINDIQYRPPVPPLRPFMFYGRDGLVTELTEYVVDDKHLALIGPGGMGKSSLAKAIINEPRVTNKFADRRFFVTYDGLDPSNITFQMFIAHFARALGIEIAGADPMRQISTFLRSASALIVLDNAETFEEASVSSALGRIPPAIAEMANIPGVTLILTSRSRRSALDVPWIIKEVPPLDSSSAQEAFFQIYGAASRECAEGGIANLLQDLGHHPLSISLLANAARQNSWSLVMLLERWKNRHIAVLDHGEGKLQSLSYSMQLSLNSPSIQKLGEDARHTLAVIAFLPQGLNEALSKRILLSILQIDTICDVLCRQSLIYRQDGFVKMLPPIRHYVQDSLQVPDSVYLPAIRAFYYDTVDSCSEERDQYANIIISDHLNIEHVVAFDLAHIPEETYDACSKFNFWIACCGIFFAQLPLPPLFSTTCLYYTLSQFTESMKAFKAAGALYLTVGNHGMATHCVTTCADIYQCQGRFIEAQQVLADFQHTESWEHLSKPEKAEVWFFLDLARMYASTTSADELFVKSLDDHVLGLRSKIWHWRAKFYYGGDIVQAKIHLEDLLPQCTSTGNFIRRDALEGLAEVAFCEGRLSKAMDILQKIVEMFEGHDSHSVLWYTVLKALVASKQGDHALGRELVNPALGLFQSFALRTAHIFLHRSYGSECVELAAGIYDRAESYFITTIEGCDIQEHLLYKAYRTFKVERPRPLPTPTTPLPTALSPKISESAHIAKKKDNGVTIPEIVWTDDLVWQLLAQIELSENRDRVVLLGKWKKGENTSGDSKVMVYQRMAAAVFPQLHSQNAVAMGD